VAEVLARWATTAARMRCARVVYLRATNEVEKVEPLHRAFVDRLQIRELGLEAHWHARGVHMHVV